MPTWRPYSIDMFKLLLYLFLLTFLATGLVSSQGTLGDCEFWIDSDRINNGNGSFAAPWNDINLAIPLPCTGTTIINLSPGVYPLFYTLPVRVYIRKCLICPEKENVLDSTLATPSKLYSPFVRQIEQIPKNYKEIIALKTDLTDLAQEISLDNIEKWQKRIKRNNDQFGYNSSAIDGGDDYNDNYATEEIETSHNEAVILVGMEVRQIYDRSSPIPGFQKILKLENIRLEVIFIPLNLSTIPPLPTPGWQNKGNLRDAPLISTFYNPVTFNNVLLFGYYSSLPFIEATLSTLTIEESAMLHSHIIIDKTSNGLINSIDSRGVTIYNSVFIHNILSRASSNITSFHAGVMAHRASICQIVNSTFLGNGVWRNILPASNSSVLSKLEPYLSYDIGSSNVNHLAHSANDDRAKLYQLTPTSIVPTALGGALYFDDSEVLIEQSVFVGNYANEEQQATGIDVWQVPSGGAIAICSASQITITSSLFHGNSAVVGGAIAQNCHPRDTVRDKGDTIEVNESFFRNNSARAYGASLSLSSSMAFSADIRNDAFVDDHILSKRNQDPQLSTRDAEAVSISFQADQASAMAVAVFILHNCSFKSSHHGTITAEYPMVTIQEVDWAHIFNVEFKRLDLISTQVVKLRRFRAASVDAISFRDIFFYSLSAKDPSVLSLRFSFRSTFQPSTNFKILQKIMTDLVPDVSPQLLESLYATYTSNPLEQHLKYERNKRSQESETKLEDEVETKFKHWDPLQDNQDTAGCGTTPSMTPTALPESVISISRMVVEQNYLSNRISLVQVDNVHSLEIRDILFSTSARPSDPGRVFHIADIKSHVFLSNITIQGTSNPIEITRARTLVIQNLLKDGRSDLQRTSWSGGLILSYINYVHVGNSTFRYLVGQETRESSAIIIRYVSQVVIFANCIFDHNAAFQRGGALDIHIGEGASVWFSNCSFSSNKANIGGAISITGNSAYLNSSFERNVANDGGAISTHGSRTCILSCEFVSNSAGSSAGAFRSTHGFNFIGHSHFIENKANLFGGAIYVENYDYSSFVSSVFFGNMARDGGAVASTRSRPPASASLFISSSSFVKNEAIGGRDQYAVRAFDQQLNMWPHSDSIVEVGRGAAIYLNNASVCSIIHTRFVDNVALVGGALYSSPISDVYSIIYSEFTNNRAFYAGGAIALLDPPLFVRSPDISPSKTDQIANILSCNFSRNYARYGGSVWTSPLNSHQLEISQSSFIANNATLGAGIYFTGTGKIPFCHNQTFFSDNIATLSGYALFINSKTTDIDASPFCDLISRCFISSGIVTNGWGKSSGATQYRLRVRVDGICYGIVTKFGAHRLPAAGNAIDSGHSYSQEAHHSMCEIAMFQHIQQRSEFLRSLGSHFSVCELYSGSYASNSTSFSSCSTFRDSFDFILPDPLNRVEAGKVDRFDMDPRLNSRSQNLLIKLKTRNQRNMDPSRDVTSSGDQDSPLRGIVPVTIHPGQHDFKAIFVDILGQIVNDYISYPACVQLYEDPQFPISGEHPLRVEPFRLFSVESAIQAINDSHFSTIISVSNHYIVTSLFKPGSSPPPFRLRGLLAFGIEVFNNEATIPHLRFESIPLVVVPVLISGCRKGEGIRPLPDASFATCQACPEGSYNLNGDGNCWLCDDPELYYSAVSCSGSNIRPNRGVWIAYPTKGRTNEFSALTCPPGFCTNCSAHDCLNTSCTPGRNPLSPLCGECQPGLFESLMFDRCSSRCSQPVVSAFIVFFILCGLFVIALHHFLFYFPGKTNSMLLFIQVLPLLHVNLSDLLEVIPSVADWACLARATPLQRLVFWSFIPVGMVFFLLVVFGVHRLIVLSLMFIRRTIDYCRKPSQEEEQIQNSLWTIQYPSLVVENEETMEDRHQDLEDDGLQHTKIPTVKPGKSRRFVAPYLRQHFPFFHSTRLTRTLLGFGMMSLIPALRLSLQLFDCVKIPSLPGVWFYAPSVACDDLRFVLTRSLLMLMLSLVILATVFVSCIAIVFYRKHTYHAQPFPNFINHFSYFFDTFRPSLYYWNVFLVLLRLTLPITVTLAHFSPGLFNFSTAVGIVLALLIQARAWSYIDRSDNILSCFLLLIMAVISLLRDTAFQSASAEAIERRTTAGILLVWILTVIAIVVFEFSRWIIQYSKRAKLRKESLPQIEEDDGARYTN